MNSNEMIEQYLCYFSVIPNLDFIRFGTRIPVVLPQRITQDDELLRILGKDEQNNMLFKYHQAKYECDNSRIFKAQMKEEQCWLDEEEKNTL